jgi:hypothetical protein
MKIARNHKADAWNIIGGLFWSEGRKSARPTQAEIELFTVGIPREARCAVVGASTKDLIEALLARDLQVSVFDFSSKMCADLEAALSKPRLRVEMLDITCPIPLHFTGSQDFILCDRLINRFTTVEAACALKGMRALLTDPGEIRASVKLGFYEMDYLMFASGKETGTLHEFYDSATQTINFAKAGDVLDRALLSHGSINRDILLRWYRGRGSETRFSHDSVLELFKRSHEQKQSIDVMRVATSPDSQSTTFFFAKHSIRSNQCAAS